MCVKFGAYFWVFIDRLVDMGRMKKYLGLTLFALSLNSVADGIDNDKNFYGKDVSVRPDDITSWRNYNGIWIKELPRTQLPNGHFMLDKRNINYWRDFDEWPCYYPIWINDGGTCVNPGDLKEWQKKRIHDWRDDINDNHHNHDVKDVPEPEAMLMIGVGLIFFGVRLKRKL